MACTAAELEYGRRYREKNRSVIQERGRTWRSRNPMYTTWYHLMDIYGLSQEDFAELLGRQMACCAACGERLVMDGPTNPDRVAVDHDHNKKKGDPGFVRGLLHHGCNTALGLVKEKVSRLEGLTRYIKTHGE